MVVVLGHADMYLGQFGGDAKKWASFGYLGGHSHAAVIIFFVLSGYVVSYANEKKNESGSYGFKAYFLDRWSRIYSVLIVAIALTLAIDYVGRQLSQFYFDPSFIPQNDFALRLFSNIFALQGIQGYRIQLGSNPALWSIGYEFIFYLLYGLLFFRKQLFHSRWISPSVFAIALAVIGWKMTVYFGVWMMGVLAYRLSYSSHLAKIKINKRWLLLIIISVNHLLVFDNFFMLSEILQDTIFAGVFAALLTFEVEQDSKSTQWKSAVNTYMADFSYSLYAFHMPLIFFFCSLFFHDSFQYMPRFLPGVLLTVMCLVMGRFFFVLAESRRKFLRRIGDRLLVRVGL